MLDTWFIRPCDGSSCPPIRLVAVVRSWNEAGCGEACGGVSGGLRSAVSQMRVANGPVISTASRGAERHSRILTVTEAMRRPPRVREMTSSPSSEVTSPRGSRTNSLVTGGREDPTAGTSLVSGFRVRRLDDWRG